MNPLVSVVVAAYKIENYLGNCIESIQVQTYSNLEIIIVNDGSPDNCYDIAMSYADNDTRIKVIDKENGGLSDARNAGISISKGEYIVIVDGDDYIQPDMIEKMYNAIINENADLCICNIQIVDEVGNQVENLALSKIENDILTKDDMYERIVQPPNWFYVVAWNKLYKREIFDKVKYKKGKIHEDEMAIHYIVGCCNKIITLEDKLYNYVQRNNSITHNGYRIQQLDIVEAFGDRAIYFSALEQTERAFRMLVRMRIVLLDGCIAIKNKKDLNTVSRINELYDMYRDIYDKIDFKLINSKEVNKLKIMRKSLKLALYTSGNFWHSLKYR
jgi:glycosyltransferase involved in cell wall biosynthesis